jgi:stage II sporulation protein D
MRSIIAAIFRAQPRRSAAALALATTLTATLVGAGPASAASGFYIRGGGDGHGIGMSQYGALGYALHDYSYAAILSHYYQGTALGSTDPNRKITVLLATGSASFSGATSAGRKRLNPSDTYTVTVSSDGSLRLTGNGHRAGSFPAPLVVSGHGPLDLTGVGHYRGSLVFRSQAGGAIETVNSVGLDDYVQGVIGEEMSPSWPAAALEAQAIASRTYVITVAPASPDYDVYADTRSQMYGGVAAETEATNAAVAATRGKVVTYHGKPAVTYFFSSSGGYTESIQDAWPGSTPEPWLVGVPDPYDNAGGNPNFRWTVSMTVRRAAAKLGSLVDGSLIGVDVIKQGASPRVVNAVVVGTQGRTDVTGAQLEQLFGLLSTNASFTTITTLAGGSGTLSAPGSGSSSNSGAGGAGTGASGTGGSGIGGPGAGASRSGTLGLHGTIFPGTTGVAIAIEQFENGAFTAVGTVKTAGGGRYTASLSTAGRYRVAYGGVNGPAIEVAAAR